MNIKKNILKSLLLSLIYLPSGESFCNTNADRARDSGNSCLGTYTDGIRALTVDRSAKKKLKRLKIASALIIPAPVTLPLIFIRQHKATELIKASALIVQGHGGGGKEIGKIRQNYKKIRGNRKERPTAKEIAAAIAWGDTQMQFCVRNSTSFDSFHTVDDIQFAVIHGDLVKSHKKSLRVDASELNASELDASELDASELDAPENQ